MNLKFAFLGMALAVVGCGSDDSSSGGSCTIDTDKDPTFKTITKADGSDAACPELDAAMLNSGDTGGDSGASSCAIVSNKAACTVDLDCEDGDTKTTGSFKVSGTSFNGDLNVVVGSVTCKYTVTGTTE